MCVCVVIGVLLSFNLLFLFLAKLMSITHPDTLKDELVVPSSPASAARLLGVNSCSVVRNVRARMKSYTHPGYNQ